MIEVYDMRRGGKAVAQVVHLASGKCVVSWPTSVAVYDSLKMAQAVHIQHMGGRGEKTAFVPVWSDTKSFMHGVNCAVQDFFEGCPWATGTDNYARDTIKAPDWQDMDAESWERGYIAACDADSGLEWRLLCASFAQQQRAARVAARPPEGPAREEAP